MASLARVPLRRLSLHSTRVSQLAPLALIKTLTWLDLSQTDVGDVAPLAHLPNLEVLDVSYTRVKDVGPLRVSRSLRELTVRGGVDRPHGPSELRAANPSLEVGERVGERGQ